MRGNITILLTICLILPGLAVLQHADGFDGEEIKTGPVRAGDNTTLYVGSGQEYTTIQSAITAADWFETIRIYNGTYYERLTIDKPLWIEGNSTEGVIINGSGQGEVIVIKHYGVSLRKMTVEGGKIVEDGDPFYAIRANHWHNSTIYVDDLEMEDLIVRNSMGGIGIFKSGSASLNNVVMQNNTYAGLLASEVKARVTNCKSTYNGGGGFLFPSSSNVDIISSNASFNGGIGLALGDGESSHGNDIMNCEVIGNSENGINIQGFDCDIINNTIRDNAWDSIFVYPNSHDIRILNNRMINNSHFYNTENIELWKDSHDISIIGNWIEGSSRYAIHMHDTLGLAPSAYDNLIYYNNFIDNGRDNSQAYDTTGQNLWNSTEFGNYWSDWTSPDSNGDNIVDNPYSTTGKGKDYLPYSKPIVSPLILNKDADDTVNNSTRYWYKPEAVDPDTYPTDLRWSLDTNASWLSMNEKDEISGSPNVRTGEFFVNVTVSDGTNSDFYNYTVNVPLFNRAPGIYRIHGNTSGYQYDEISQVFFVYDINGDETSFDFNIGKKLHIPWGGEYNISEERFEGYDVDDVEDQLPNHAMIENDNWGYEVENFEMREYSITFWMDLSDQSIWETDNGSVNIVEFTLAMRVWDDYGGMNSTVVAWTLYDVNDPPEIAGDDNTKAYVNNTLISNFDSIDIDTQPGNLSWDLKSNATFLDIDGTTGVLSGTPSQSDIGSFWVNVSVSDGEGGIDWTNFTLTVSFPTDNLGSLGILEMDEDGQDSSLSIESIFYGLHYDDINLISFQADHFTLYIHENGSIVIVPEENWAGMELVTITARFGDVYLKRTLIINIENLNDPPTDADIILPDIEFRDGWLIDGHATVIDADMPYGESLNYTWTIDGIGVIGTGEYFNVSLPPGTYQLKVLITDSSGATTEAVRTIEVKSGPDVDPLLPLRMIIVIIILFGIIILIPTGFIVNQMRGRKRNADEDENSTIPPIPSTSSGSLKMTPPGGEIIIGGSIEDLEPDQGIEDPDLLISEDIEFDPSSTDLEMEEVDAVSVLEEIRTESLMGNRPSDSLPENPDIMALAESRFDDGDISSRTLKMIKEILDE